jgi:hypothetical protein
LRFFFIPICIICKYITNSAGVIIYLKKKMNISCACKACFLCDQTIIIIIDIIESIIFYLALSKMLLRGISYNSKLFLILRIAIS